KGCPQHSGRARWQPAGRCDITERMAENRPLNDAEALAALDWYRAAGVDLAQVEAPVDRFAASLPAARARVPAGTPVQPGGAPSPAPAPSADVAAPAVALSRDADPSETRALAASANTLDELRAVMDAYDGCLLKKRATQLCFADGNPDAEIM